MARLEDCVVRQQMRLDQLDKTVELQDGRLKALERENSILKANISTFVRKAELQDDKIESLEGRCSILERFDAISQYHQLPRHCP